MIRLATLAIFISLSLSAALATPNFKFAAVARAADTPFNLNYTPVDYEYGKNLDQLFSDLGRNILNKSIVKNLSTLQKKKHSYSILDATIERLQTVLEISSQDSFYKNCSISSKKVNSYTDSVSDRINISVDRHCRYLFLKKLTALSANINFSSRDLAYFKEAAPFFVTGENQPEVVAFLRYFKSNAVEHEKLSNILIEKYIELNLKPATNVLTNIKINAQFNRFLQNNLNIDDVTKSYFQEEFQRLSRDAQDSANSGDFVQAKTLITSAINFYHKNKNFISDKKAWTGTVLTAKALFYKGRDSDAIEIFNMARLIAPKEETSETLFYLLWPHIINKDYKAMKSIIDKNNFEKSFDNYDSKLQYWIAYAILKTGDSKKSASLFNKIISKSPYSFYSIIALKELAAASKGASSEQDILSKLVSKDEPTDFSMEKVGATLKDSLRRLAVWNKIGNERFATLELRYIQTLSKEQTFLDSEFSKVTSAQAHKEFIIMNLIRLLNFQKKYITSFKVFQDSLDQNSLSLNYKLIKFIFPLNYFDLIKKNSANLDPLIVISLIRQESAFNPEARSGVGAKGLMQLMPATAKRFNRKIKVNHLGNPEINVAIGVKYLKLLIERFDGNLIYALASYNAGENRIDRWRKEIFRNDDPLTTIESIPYEETRNYVKLIYRNNFFYSLLSNRSVLMVPLEETFKVAINPKSF